MIEMKFRTQLDEFALHSRLWSVEDCKSTIGILKFLSSR